MYKYGYDNESLVRKIWNSAVAMNWYCVAECRISLEEIVYIIMIKIEKYLENIFQQRVKSNLLFHPFHTHAKIYVGI